MASLNYRDSFRDVNSYPTDLLEQLDHGVRVFVTYKKIWNDGFGARGWKLNATIGDPEIIASTRETGRRINTSVFIHDILDHFISGFGVSGHRSEAMALIQLSNRTGSNPRSDFRQLVIEDILTGRVNGESLRTFLPAAMLSLLPFDKVLTDAEIIATISDSLSHDTQVEMLVDRFVQLGKEGQGHAIASWRKLGLDPANAGATGIALQKLLEKVDYEAECSGVDRLDASIVLNNEDCIFITTAGEPEFSESVYHAEIAP